MTITESFKKLFRPLKDGTLQAVQVLKVIRPKAPAPAAADFTNPLRAELQTLMDRKAQICTHHCTGCSHATGNTCAFDTQTTEILANYDNPEPFLVEMIDELKKTRNENTALRKDLAATRQDVNPIRRMMYLFGAGIAGLTAKAVWDVWGYQWFLSILPLLLPLLPLL